VRGRETETGPPRNGKTVCFARGGEILRLSSEKEKDPSTVKDGGRGSGEGPDSAMGREKKGKGQVGKDSPNHWGKSPIRFGKKE